MSNKFCRQLSNGYKINIQGNKILWSPCCFYSKKTDINDVKAFNSEINYTSSVTNWIPECNTCRVIEQNGLSAISPRLQSFNRISQETTNGACADLEISFDTRCNAACITCGSYASSTWAKFNKKHNLRYAQQDLSVHTKLTTSDRDYYNQFLKYPLTPNDNSMSDVFLHRLIETVPMDKLQHVYMMGGEPLWSKTHIKLIKHILAIHPEPNTISLSYQTNGSIYPAPEVFELWANFKKIIIAFSIDGIEERFNYTRWPLRWNVVEQNLLNFINNKYHNIIMGIDVTISPLNFWYYDEVANWAFRHIPEQRWRMPNPAQVVKPNRSLGDPLDLNRTPNALREEFYTKYGEIHPVSLMLKSLPNFNNPKVTHQMVNYLNNMDRLRKTNWATTFPEMVKFFNN